MSPTSCHCSTAPSEYSKQPRPRLGPSVAAERRGQSLPETSPEALPSRPVRRRPGPGRGRARGGAWDGRGGDDEHLLVGADIAVKAGLLLGAARPGQGLELLRVGTIGIRDPVVLPL